MIRSITALSLLFSAFACAPVTAEESGAIPGLIVNPLDSACNDATDGHNNLVAMGFEMTNISNDFRLRIYTGPEGANLIVIVDEYGEIGCLVGGYMQPLGEPA